MDQDGPKKMRSKFYSAQGDFRRNLEEVSTDFRQLVQQQQKCQLTPEEIRKYAQEKLITRNIHQQNAKKICPSMMRSQKRTIGWFSQQFNNPKSQNFTLQMQQNLQEELEQQHLAQQFVKYTQDRSFYFQQKSQKPHPEKVQVYSLIQILEFAAKNILDIQENMQKEIQSNKEEQNTRKSTNFQQKCQLLKTIFGLQTKKRNQIGEEGWLIYNSVNQFDKKHKKKSLQQVDQVQMSNQDQDQ